MAAVAEDDVGLVAPGRRVRRWRTWLAALVAIAVAVVGLSLWLSYQPLRPGSTGGGGDARIGEGNPFAPPAVLIRGPDGHVSHVGVSVWNDGRFPVTIDRVDFPLGWLSVVSGISTRGPDRALKFPDRIAPHGEGDYWFTVRMHGCFDVDGMSTFDRVRIHFHALGIARTAEVKLLEGVALTGTGHCAR